MENGTDSAVGADGRQAPPTIAADENDLKRILERVDARVDLWLRAHDDALLNGDLARQITAQVEERLSAYTRPQMTSSQTASGGHTSVWVALASLGFGVPMVAVSTAAGLAGMIAVLVALVALNAVVAFGGRR